MMEVNWRNLGVKIPFFKSIYTEDDRYYASVFDVIKSGQYIGGEEVKRFEDKVKAFYGVKHAIGCNSGTDALYLALVGSGVWYMGYSVPALTFVATAEAVIRSGAQPVFIDVDDESLCADSALSVNLYGNETQACEIQDMCQAFGANFVGEFGCFSFFPTKVLGGIGDGGMVITNNDEAAETIRSVQQHGRSKENKYEYERHGINSRLDPIQAAVLNVRIDGILEELVRRKELADMYDNYLRGYVRLPYKDSVYNYYVIRSPERDKIKKHLDSEGIGCMIYFPKSLNQYDLFPDAECPVAEKACRENLALPFYPNMKNEHVKIVSDAVKRALES